MLEKMLINCVRKIINKPMIEIGIRKTQNLKVNATICFISQTTFLKAFLQDTPTNSSCQGSFFSLLKALGRSRRGFKKEDDSRPVRNNASLNRVLKTHFIQFHRKSFEIF